MLKDCLQNIIQEESSRTQLAGQGYVTANPKISKLVGDTGTHLRYCTKR